MARSPVLVKLYGGHRLYDTVAGCYTQAPALRAWQARGIAFVVIDAQTGEDVTRRLLG